MPQLHGDDATSISSRQRRALALERPIASSLALPESHVDAIEHSHERCAALGLSRIELPEFAPLGRSDLTVVRDRNRRLHSHAAPIMGMLFDQIVGTESLVVLCDAAGTIIHSIGDDEFLARASKVALSPGVNWSEQAKGTNAVGTALIEEAPTLVHADEHFMHANQFLTCSAAPILDPRGNILGVLDVSGDHRSYHQHTMALVRMSARMIENHWLSDDFRNLMRLHFHSRVEVLGTLMEGILAVSPDGRIVGANRGALEQLDLSGASLRVESVSSLFGTTVGALVDRFRSPLATPMPVHTNQGRRFHLHARFNWPVWSQVTDAAAATSATAVDAARTVSASALRPMASLARLRTGDTQMSRLLDKVMLLRDRGIPMLLIGETGTGKEVLARAIHSDSRRAAKPFVCVDCATVTEAELFGEEAGGGQLAQAQGGTLFLDEVGELPAQLQRRLLRVLQEGQVVTSTAAAPETLDVAIVSASQRPLQQRIAEGQFRDDLYFRLNGGTLTLPTLRERSDMAALVRNILDGEDAGQHMRPSTEVLELFAQHAWPGNVRELFNVLRLAVVMAGSDRLITRHHLPDELVQASRPAAEPPRAPPVVASPDSGAGSIEVSRSLEAVEIEAIRIAVDAAGGNISQAAKALGISRNTIYRKLRWNQRSSS